MSFKPGSIIKISVSNFVTYTYAEMYPGPKLNMLIGPNGTGKSTIVAAIILGLGGSPKVIGRGSNVSEYVKHNCEEATINILLQGDKEEEQELVTRIFNKQNRNEWKLNNKKQSQKEVLDYIKKYRIQVDNLCQFLPQDRVADFAKMNKQELLKQTQIALCRDDLISKQTDLIQSRERHRYLVNNVNNLSKKLQNLKDENIRLEGKVINFNERNKYVASIVNIQRKKVWLEYLEVVERREEMKTEKERLQRELKKQQDAVKPIENALDDARKVVNNVSAEYDKYVAKLRESETAINKNINKHYSTKESIDKIKADCLAKIKEIEQREKELQDAQTRLETLLKDKAELIAKIGDDSHIQDKLKSMRQDIQKISANENTLEEKKTDLTRRKREKLYEIRGLENELTRLDNVKQQRLEFLRRVDQDAYEAAMWLRDNKHLFKGEVYSPMMLEINVDNPKYAVYVEKSINFRDKVAFTCTLKEDMNLLIRTLCSEKNLSVNIVHSDNQIGMEHYQPIYPIEQLRRFGFQVYVSSLFRAPEPILKYLYRSYNLHNLPVAFEKTNINFEKLPKEITSFYEGNFRFSISRSKYTNETITKQFEVTTDGSLSISIDQARIETINGQLLELRGSCEAFDEKVASLDQTILEVQKQSDKIKEKIKTIRDSKQQVDSLESRIKVMKNKISNMGSNRQNKENIEEESKREIQNTLKKLVEIQKNMVKLFKKYTQEQIQYELEGENLDISRKQIRILENRNVDLRNALREAEVNYNKINDEFAEITREAKEILAKAKNKSDGFTPDDDGFKKFRKEYDKLSDNIETLDAEMDILNSKIDCLTNAANEDEMKEYEKRIKDIQRLENDITAEGEEINEIINNMDQMQRDWLEPLQELINEINGRFRRAFEVMGCAGEVDIYKGDIDKDYEKYGISIKVTFRNQEPLQELNTVTQSGGERAVATATYMLALQDLTPVPFRCVDEINQGMDENNERRVFELLVDTTCKEDSSQYFLITPKLLPDLKYVPSMKIHIVHNGPFVCDQNSWNRAADVG